MSAMKDSGNCRSTEPIVCTPSEWLPSNIEQYYRYEGSLTTDPFSETVSWVAFRRPKKIKRNLLERLIEGFGHHARLLQPLPRRFVLRNFR